MGSPAGKLKVDYEGMILEKYPLLEQESVGTSLKANDTKQHAATRSKL